MSIALDLQGHEQSDFKLSYVAPITHPYEFQPSNISELSKLLPVLVFRLVIMANIKTITELLYLMSEAL